MVSLYCCFGQFMCCKTNLPTNLQVDEIKGDDVICLSRNAATLAGALFTLHASQVHIGLPTLTEKDKEV